MCQLIWKRMWPVICMMSHAIDEAPVGCLQISTGPVRDPQERSGSSAPQMIILGQEVNCPPSMFHSCRARRREPRR